MKKTGLLLLGIFSTLSGVANAHAYIVDSYEDNGEKGTLRWAINQSNSNKEQENEILIKALGKSPYIIKINKPLPPVKSPVKIIGEAWEKTGDYIVIDGSAYIQGEGAKTCPGANPDQYGTNVRTMTLPGLVLQDVNGVTLSGLDIHRFCIGVLINRSSNNTIQFNRISNNYGGSGIMLTGDDGKGNPTSKTTNNNKVIDNIFINNGDGLELTRGAAFNLIANNVFTSTKDNPEPSQGIEILWGNDNIVVGNKFENYSDGLQINWGKRNYIAYNEVTNNSLGFNLSGDGNIFDSNKVHNNRIGIAIRSEKDSNARTTLTKNLVWNNGKDIKRCEAGGSCVLNQKLGSIVFGIPGLEHADFIGSRGGGVIIEESNLQKTCNKSVKDNCNSLPNQAIQSPKLSFVKNLIVADINAQPNQLYKVEFFGNTQKSSQEAEKYLGSELLITDNNGVGRVYWKNREGLETVTATLTNHLGATSELSSAISIF